MQIKQINQAVLCESHIKKVKETNSKINKFVLRTSSCRTAEKLTLEKCRLDFFLVYLPNFIFASVEIVVSKGDSVLLPP